MDVSQAVPQNEDESRDLSIKLIFPCIPSKGWILPERLGSGADKKENQLLYLAILFDLTPGCRRRLPRARFFSCFETAPKYSNYAASVLVVAPKMFTLI